MKQERTLLLTNKALYNLKKIEVQRSIHVKNIRFLTQSTKDGNKEFVVHVKNEYDYRFESDYRSEIFDAIKYVYWKHFGTNI